VLYLCFTFWLNNSHIFFLFGFKSSYTVFQPYDIRMPGSIFGSRISRSFRCFSSLGKRAHLQAHLPGSLPMTSWLKPEYRLFSVAILFSSTISLFLASLMFCCFSLSSVHLVGVARLLESSSGKLPHMFSGLDYRLSGSSVFS